MLCGINTSFPVVSRFERQVAHALLTRPPLSYARRHSSVRLECVMHAASVHPEPGSNSRLKKFYLSFYLLFLLRNCRDSWLFDISILLPSYFFVLSLRCSIFKDHSLATPQSLLFGALYYYSIIFFKSQPLFQKNYFLVFLTNLFCSSLVRMCIFPITDIITCSIIQ